MDHALPGGVSLLNVRATAHLGCGEDDDSGGDQSDDKTFGRECVACEGVAIRGGEEGGN